MPPVNYLPEPRPVPFTTAPSRNFGPPRRQGGTYVGPVSIITTQSPMFRVSDGTTDLLRVQSDPTGAGMVRVNGVISSETGGFLLKTIDSATTFSYPFLYQKRGTTGDASAAVTANSELGTLTWQAWNGSAYASCAQVVGRANQNQSPGAAGGFIQFNTTPNGTASMLTRAIISAQGNILLSNTVTAEPASMVGGVVLKNGTAASGDPTGAGAMWFTTADGISYRTDIASEGSGQTNLLHNRAAQQYGAGTDFTLPGGAARVTFGTTNAEVTLPTAGTYLVEAQVSFITGTTALDEYQCKLRNATDSTDIGALRRYVQPVANALRVTVFLSEIVPVTASKAIQIFALNPNSRGTIESTTTVMKYVRLF